MAAELLTGIIAALKGAASLATVADADITTDVAREEAAYPYIVVNDVGGAIKATYEATFVDARTIRISVYHTDQSAIVTLQGAVHTLLDKQKPSLTGAGVIGCLRTGDFIRSAGKSASNTQVFQAVSTYRIQVQDDF
jgi:hypothetical protein